ncbi:hypothetical protein Syun_002169 [Stephania yunnanensis]|uniref:Uncharacterized protein n=1 Tax=Stephania yunnanensis TaxID=152371 RepID=A0AAP0LKZ2_9MAGN
MTERRDETERPERRQDRDGRAPRDRTAKARPPGADVRASTGATGSHGRTERDETIERDGRAGDETIGRRDETERQFSTLHYIRLQQTTIHPLVTFELSVTHSRADWRRTPAIRNQLHIWILVKGSAEIRRNDGPGTRARAQRSRTRLGDPQARSTTCWGFSMWSFMKGKSEKNLPAKRKHANSSKESDRLRQVIEKEMLKVETLMVECRDRHYKFDVTKCSPGGDMPPVVYIGLENTQYSNDHSDNLFLIFWMGRSITSTLNSYGWEWDAFKNLTVCLFQGPMTVQL